MDDAVDVYRELAKIPSVKGGSISNKSTTESLQVSAVWSQRDLNRKENVNFTKHYVAQPGAILESQPQELSKVEFNVESPSGKLVAVLRKVPQKSGDDKQFIEIWNGNQKTHNIEVDNIEEHGKIYSDITFGCLEWSQSETQLLYVAEKKRPKPKSYFDSEKTSTEENKDKAEGKGEEFVYQDDWGEQLTGKCQSVPCILELSSASVRVFDCLPDNACAGMAVWCPDDSGILCVGTYPGPYRLGIIYCAMRRSALFHINLKTNTCEILGEQDHSVASPVFSPDRSKFVYSENKAGGPHMQCRRLKMCNWSTKEISTVTEQVRNTTDPDEFPGIHMLSLNRRCWAQDCNRLVLNTQWRSKSELVVIDCESHQVTRLTNNPAVGSWTLLDMKNDVILASCTSPSKPHYLVQGSLPGIGSESSIQWTQLDCGAPQISGISWSIHQMEVPKDRVNSSFAGLSYEYIVLESEAKDPGKKRPLIVFPHGGPHSVFSAELMMYPACLCRLGFVIVCVNYRGSYGFGQDCIECLPGNVGTQDVQDVQAVAEKVLTTHNLDQDNVFVMGGSHGGFLTLHLIGQYPDFYKAAIARNAVCNIASMMGATDIVDWTFVEVGLPNFDHRSIATPEMYTKSWNMSPIRYIDQVKAPVLLCVGLDDRRVPPKQSEEYRRALAARNIPVKMLHYPENAHPIIKVDSEADCFVNIAKWFRQYSKH